MSLSIFCNTLLHSPHRSSPKCPDRLWSATRFLFNWCRCSISGVKRPGRDVDHSTPSSADVVSPPLCLFSVDKDNCTFTCNVENQEISISCEACNESNSKTQTVHTNEPVICTNTAELHLSGLIGTASHPDMQKIRIIGFFY